MKGFPRSAWLYLHKSREEISMGEVRHQASLVGSCSQRQGDVDRLQSNINYKTMSIPLTETIQLNAHVFYLTG